MFGLGKKRSKFGAFLDRHGIEQEEIRKLTKLNKDTISKACNEIDPKMRSITKDALVKAAAKLSGKEIDKKSFWG
ncbi:transcriptional regulator [Paenibacillus algicola]|uniref:transcriptional regulator n=1 Tax=Paenibacillus algicola TaxID=2565926 RepID=UPI0010FF2062|nr:transcriptional regulator [Paenibacillus algicola]